ncbi:MAG: hypothetical protein IH624_10385 [Phycisphaerae bacterium]|nr:hypothetical protein [Phycisphaerae bacterium]
MEKCGVLRLCVVFAAALGGGLPAAWADERPTGRLMIVGEHIERLVLVDQHGESQIYSGDDLNTGISLAPDRYRPREVYLKGGYQCHLWSEMQFAPVKVEAGQTTELKVGAPLTQGLKVERRGKLFLLQYELQGVGGETYTAANRGAPPEFAVYKGDRKVGGGRFEYG